MRKHSFLFEEILLKSWWVILFFLLCYFAYDQGIKKRNKEGKELTKKLHELEEEQLTALKIQEEYKREIESQSDPAWIELVLMKRLGLVPEGSIKVVFSKSETN